MDNLAITPREKERLEKTLDALPEDVVNGLEIGFNDLRVTNLLRERIDLVSIDLPRKVANHQGHSLAFADIRRLPFKDNIFDVVVCTEVLEHLPLDTLLTGLEELQRVSRKYLLVSVPYKQRVWNKLFKCAHCNFMYNSMGHLHYFDDIKLLALFNGVTSQKLEFIGTAHGYAPDWLYWAASRLGNAWLPLEHCPSCKR